MRIFGEYVKHHRRGIILFAGIIILQALFVNLYQAPGEMALYFAALCLFLGCCCVCADFVRYRRQHLTLLQMQKEILVSFARLPDPDNLIQQDYEELLGVMESALKDLRTASAKNEQNMLDYYTLWVHQIKTPIAAMGLILQEADSETNRDLKTQLFKIEQYVELVLQYIRLESPSTDYDLRSQELDGIVRQAVRKYAPLFIRKKLNLAYEPLDKQVLTDEKWLCFVLEQILSNALKYTEKGQISIYMDESRKKTLVIEDTGIGISPEDLPRIGDKNYTGYNGRKDKKASGLGMYLSKKILERLGHEIQILSNPGGGTKVMIHLEHTKVAFE